MTRHTHNVNSTVESVAKRLIDEFGFRDFEAVSAAPRLLATHERLNQDFACMQGLLRITMRGSRYAGVAAMHAGLQNIVLWTASTCAPPPSVVHPADGSSKGPSSRRSLLLILLVSYMMFLAPAGAADRRVPPDYPTIQGAFNAAQFGDRVLIAMGTYHEPLTLNRRGIELAGAGIGQTMLDGSSNGSGALLLISSVDSTVIARNITFTGQHAAGSAGGIRVVNASPIIVDCEIADNRGATGGGGIYVYGFDRANPIICRNIIRNNETISWGGGAAALTTSAAATES